MKRYLFITTILSAMLLIISSNFAFAADEECDACNTTSPYVDNYINFANELIKTFQTYANQQAYTFQQQWQTNVTNGWSQVNTNTNWQFVQTDANREFQAIVDNLNQKAQATASSIYVLWLVTIEGAFLDSWKNIAPLMNGKAILRDRQKLETVWQSITSTLLDLWNNWVFERLWFRQWRDARIEEIITRYSSMENAPISFNGKLYSQPRDVLWALRRMNQALKTTIWIWANNIIDNSDNKFLWWQITFSQSAQENLLSYYKCARWTIWISCSKAWAKAKENLENTRKETTSKTQDAKKIITDSLKRLSWFWSNNGWAKKMLEQRTNELLRAEYWRQWVRNNKWETIWQWLKNGLNNAFWFKETRKTLKNDTMAIGPFAWLREVNQPKQWEPFVVWDLATKQIRREDEAVLRWTFNSITATARENRQESTYADVSSVTKLLPMITAEIVASKWRIDDNKNKESLVENLWKACDLQCRNLWWKCRYQ